MRGSLRGISWNHTRGYVPLVATAQRFEDLFEGVEISWDKRSLREFGDLSVAELIAKFDLLVIDHPHVGHLASHRSLIPLDRYFGQESLDDLRRNAVGKSFDSYRFDGSIWALPLDAAAPVSSARADLMKEHGVQPPQTWQELLGLARQGFVAVPATPVDSLMNFFMLCCSLGESPFECEDRVVGDDVGIEALHLLRELIRACSPECLVRNPIQTYGEMVLHRGAFYCPFAFGYSNYSRTGYAPAELEFGDLVTLNGRPLQSTLGGAGIAVSATSSNIDLAVDYLAWVVSLRTQRSLYFEAGGQPGDRRVWQDNDINRRCNNFFSNTLPVLDRAYLRPRYDGYVQFQNEASVLVHDHLSRGGDPERTLHDMNKVQAKSLAS